MFLALPAGMVTERDQTRHRTGPSAWQWFKVWWRARRERPELLQLDARADSIAALSAKAVRRMIESAERPRVVRRRVE